MCTRVHVAQLADNHAVGLVFKRNQNAGFDFIPFLYDKKNLNICTLKCGVLYYSL
jgi:hypothetical protein